MTPVRFGASSIGCIIAITPMALPAGGQTTNPLAKEYLQVAGEIDQHLQRNVILVHGFRAASIRRMADSQP